MSASASTAWFRGGPKDTLGIGWARIQLSSDFVPFLRQRLDLGLSVEDAVEIYYNAAITPWLNMAADLQIVDSALDKTLTPSRQLVNMGTAVVGGLRMHLRFWPRAACPPPGTREQLTRAWHDRAPTEASDPRAAASGLDDAVIVCVIDDDDDVGKALERLLRSIGEELLTKRPSEIEAR